MNLGKPFQGVWGAFPYLDETCTVVRTLRDQGRDYSVITPTPRHELEHAMGDPVSRIPWVALCFGALGIFFGYGFPSWVSLDWVLPVGQKPIVGLPAFTIIGFELMVLLGGVSTACAILLMGYYSLFKKPLPGSPRFRGYGRFSDDRFGVVVRCAPGEAEGVERLMREHSAEEVVREY